MDISKGKYCIDPRPVITINDDPLLVAEAMRTTINLARSCELETDDPEGARLNAWISRSLIHEQFNVRDGEIRNPDAQVTLSMSVDELESALVTHGLSPERTEAEGRQIDRLLLSVDGLKPRIEEWRRG